MKKHRKKDLRRLECVASLMCDGPVPWFKDSDGNRNISPREIVGFRRDCPVCKNDSLVVTLRYDNKDIDLNCIKGCLADEILDAVGMKKKDRHLLNGRLYYGKMANRKREKKSKTSSTTVVSESSNLPAIVTKEQTLPDTVEGLQEFILIEGTRLEAYRAALKKVDRLNIAQDVWIKTLSDAQGVARALLYAEVTLGNLLKAIPNKRASSARGTCSLPEGITKKQSHEAQLLADHEGIVEQTIWEAEQNKDIPSRRAVLKSIERTKKSQRQSAKSEFHGFLCAKTISFGVLKKRLLKCLALLREPFPHLEGDELGVVRELARSISRKLLPLFPELTSPPPAENTKQKGEDILMERNGEGAFEVRAA